MSRAYKQIEDSDDSSLATAANESQAALKIPLDLHTKFTDVIA